MRHFSVNPLNAPFSEYPLLSAYLDRGGIRLHNWWGVLLYRIGTLVPDLAIEVLSAGNTEGEMRRKLHDYFTAGVRLVWYIDPRTRPAKAYTAENACSEVSAADSLSGGDVLPGFVLPLRELFGGLGT
jgi:hypothetical protein